MEIIDYEALTINVIALYLKYILLEEFVEMFNTGNV